MEVYSYIPADKVGNAIECGLKLSEWYNREVIIGGDSRKCMSTLLNPRDNTEYYRSADFRCLKFELYPTYCYVADKSLFDIGANSHEIMQMYIQSIIPAEKYIFGMYRLPECLVTCTVLPEQITVMDKKLDSPILFSSSEELYVNNKIETYKEKCDDFSDVMLYCFYSKLEEEGRMHKVENLKSRMAIFIDKETGESCIVGIPDIKKYYSGSQGCLK